MLCSGVTLIMHIAPQLFPKDKNTEKFLMKFYKEALHVQMYKLEMLTQATMYPECFSLFHPNTQLDNAVYYYTDEACTQMEASVIDWASMTGQPFLISLASNLLSGSEPTMLEEYYNQILGTFVDTYHEAGGSKRLDLDTVKTIVFLGFADTCSGIMGFTRIIQNNLPPQDPRWKQFKDRWDPAINDNYVRRATIAQCNHVLEAWCSEKLDLYGHFKRWLRRNDKILVKRDLPKPMVPNPPPPKVEPKVKAKK